jgi:hypothetical protein
MATKSLEKVEFLAQADTDRADAFEAEALPDSRGIWHSGPPAFSAGPLLSKDDFTICRDLYIITDV